jgi:TolB protein
MTKSKRNIADKLIAVGAWAPLVVALFLAPSNGQSAGREIEIVGEAGRKTRVAVRAFTVSGRPDTSALTKTLTATLTFDLGHSGFFLVVPDEKEAEILVRADYALSGGGIMVRCSVSDAVAGKTLFGRQAEGEQNQPRRAVHRMADAIVKAMTGVDGIASTRIVFVADRGGKDKNIYLVDYDGENVTQLTRDKGRSGRGLSLAPDWSPDGRRIYYTTYVYGDPRVCAIELSTWKRWVISAYPGLNAFPAISPTGNEMVLTLSKDGCVEIYGTTLQGRKATRLTRSRGGVATSPCWSPRGTEIAFVSNRGGGPQIYVMNADGTNVRRLLSGFSYVTSLDWSPTGDKIAFSARQGGALQIFVLDRSRRRAKQVTSDPASHENPSFAPNGRHIVYVATRGYTSDLYVVDTEDPKPYRLTSLEGDETYPAWSPVGF